MASVYSTNLSLVPGIGPKTEVTTEAFLAIIQTCLKADSCHFNEKNKKRPTTTKTRSLKTICPC